MQFNVNATNVKKNHLLNELIVNDILALVLLFGKLAN